MAGRLGANGAQGLFRFSEESAIETYERVYTHARRSLEMVHA
jgi:hypothetical protein